MPATDRNIDYQRLTARRLRAAEHRLRCYDFGASAVAFGGWSHLGREGGHWRCPVRLWLGNDGLEVIFAITFATGTNHMIEAYAITAGGAPLLVGKWSDDVLREAAMTSQSESTVIAVHDVPGGSHL